MILGTAFDLFKYSTQDQKNPFRTLGISPIAGNDAVKRAWRKEMMKNHPDLGGSVQKTVEINEAYHSIRKRRGF